MRTILRYFPWFVVDFGVDFNFPHAKWYLEVSMDSFISILSGDSDAHSSQVEELQNTNSELEAKCKKFSDQLSLLSNDLQSAEDVNLNLLEQIDHLKEEIAKKGWFLLIYLLAMNGNLILCISLFCFGKVVFSNVVAT